MIRSYISNVEYFKETLRKFEEEKKKPLKLVIIDDYNNRGITLYLTGVIGPVRDTLDRAGIMRHLGEEHFFLDISEAITYSEGTRKKPIKDYTLQTFR